MLKKSICLNRKRYCFNYDLDKPKSINNKIGNIDSNIIEVKSDLKCKQNPIESNSIEKNSNLTKMKEQYNMNKLNKIDLRNFNDESQNFKSSKINFKQINSKVNSYQINTINCFNSDLKKEKIFSAEVKNFKKLDFTIFDDIN